MHDPYTNNVRILLSSTSNQGKNYETEDEDRYQFEGNIHSKLLQRTFSNTEKDVDLFQDVTYNSYVFLL